MANELTLSDEELLDLLTSTVEINKYGAKIWRNKDGWIHRQFGPAFERTDGYKGYYLNGERHRTDGPAIEWPDGSKEYWVKGSRHRTDGPAVIHPDGSTEYFLNDEQVEPF